MAWSPPLNQADRKGERFRPPARLDLRTPMMNPRLAVAFCATLCLALTGCGGSGGGGGTKSASSLTYTTDWTHNGASGPSGQSQRITLLQGDGTTVVASTVLNAQSGSQSYTFSNVPAGTYIVKAELNDQASFQGNTTGVLEAFLDTTTAKSLTTEVGVAPTGLTVSPATASIATGQGQQFFADVHGADGNLTFAPGATLSPTWSGANSFFSVTNAGVVTGLAAGSGSVGASLDGFTGAANVTVTSSSTTHGKWTILVYLNAANNLYPYADLNMKQMAQAASNSNVRFVVQWKETQQIYPGSEFDGTRRYVVKSGASPLNNQLVQNLGDGIDMGDPQTLNDFINWGKANFPADHYALVVWDHGDGWMRAATKKVPSRAVSYDDETGSAIQTWQLSQAIGNNHLDILSYDACLMQMLEIADEVQTQVDYIATSEELTPADGYPYNTVFAGFASNPDQDVRTLTEGFVTGMMNDSEYEGLQLTQSVVDSSKIPALATAVSTLADQLIANQSAVASTVQQIRKSGEHFDPTTPGEYYYDLYDVASRLQSSGSVPVSVSNAASAVMTAVKNAVVWEGHSTADPNAHGIAIDFSPASSFASNSADYAKLKLANTTDWGKWLAVAP